MRYSVDKAARERSSKWLRGHMAKQGYKRQSGRYDITDFANKHGLSDVTIGRYIRNDRPVLPGLEACRSLADATGEDYVEVLCATSYLTQDDIDQHILRQLATRKWRKVIAEMREAEADDTARTLGNVA